MKTIHVSGIQTIGTLFVTALFVAYDKLVTSISVEAQYGFVFFVLAWVMLLGAIPAFRSSAQD